jgi:hypothetical protein
MLLFVAVGIVKELEGVGFGFPPVSGDFHKTHIFDMAADKEHICRLVVTEADRVDGVVGIAFPLVPVADASETGFRFAGIRNRLGGFSPVAQL